LQELIATKSFVFSLRNADVKATGRVGLSLEEDSFKTINYDVLYEPIGSYLSVRELSFNFNAIYVLFLFLLLIHFTADRPRRF
jgi:hypothetical protein